MAIPSEYSFIRYLSSKKSVDDRSLNKNVWASLLKSLPRTSDRLHVLEIGAGIGTMVERAVQWGLFRSADYTAIDSQPENIQEARNRFQAWAESIKADVETNESSILFRNDSTELAVSFETADVLEFIEDPSRHHAWDLLIANAFLDLVDIGENLPKLLSLIKTGGLFYFTINFDGATIYEPEIDPELDALIEKLYHETMDKRIINGKLSGDSRTGRHFFQQAREAGAELLDAGASDWVVFPDRNGYYEDEAYFLHFLVDTMHLALRDRPELDPDKFSAWIDKRHKQIEDKSLVYIAHQIDFVGKVP